MLIRSKPLGSAEEATLVSSMGDNTTITKLGIDMRALLPQNELDRKLSKNREIARKARASSSSATSSSLSKKKQGPMQQLFDKISKDDPSIKEVNLQGDPLFLSLRNDDRLQAAKSFAMNTNVKSVRMTMLQLDDEFARALGESLSKNQGIEKLVLDSNAFTGQGIQAILGGLAKNETCKECQLRHQKKPMATSDEEALPDLLSENKYLTKLGVDLRSSLAQRQIENMISKNRDEERKNKSKRENI